MTPNPAMDLSLSEVSLGQPDLCEDYLVRFPFSIWPKGRQKINKINLIITLWARDGKCPPVVSKLMPGTEYELQPTTYDCEIGLNLHVIYAKVKKLSLPRSIPVISACGIGKNIAVWVFNSTPTNQLQGDYAVHALLKQPFDISRLRAEILISVDIVTLRGLRHKCATDYLDWEIL